MKKAVPASLAYLGPPGTFGEEAALLYNNQAYLIPFLSHHAIASAVQTGLADEGIMAIENSLEGSVNDTLDLLIYESGLMIKKEMALPIEHYMLVKPGTQTQEIKIIYSHPQALAQCRHFLERIFPKAQMVAALSTAAAVEQMISSPEPSAAIGSKRSAELYGADILARGIQNNLLKAPNITRFVVVAREDSPPTGYDKTSICFYIGEDRPGSLFNVLEGFARRNINLTKIESRPSKESLGKYFFLVDMEGHKLEPLVAETLKEVKAKTALFKIFGSYPRYREISNKL